MMKVFTRRAKRYYSEGPYKIQDKMESGRR